MAFFLLNELLYLFYKGTLKSNNALFSTLTVVKTVEFLVHQL